LQIIPAAEVAAAIQRRRRARAEAPRAAATLPERELRRRPTPVELRAAVDFAAMDTAYSQTLADVEALWERRWLPDALAAITAAIRYTKSGKARVRVTRADMARVGAPTPDPEPLADMLLTVARTAAESATGELMTQGVDVLLPSDAELRARVADHAQAVAAQTADGLTLAAARKAVQLAAQRTSEEVAQEVGAYMAGLAHRWERDQLAGAVQQATNAGRAAVFERVPDEAPLEYVASELLDENTCDECEDVDGTTFPTLEAALRAYPSGGFHACRGGPRCRGTIVAVLPEDEVDPAEREAFPELWGEPV
jgi:hypothetical protein